MVIVPLSQPASIRRKFVQSLFRSLLVAAFIASLAAFFIAQTLTLPISSLEKAARKISGGDFSDNFRHLSSITYSLDLFKYSLFLDFC